MSQAVSVKPNYLALWIITSGALVIWTCVLLGLLYWAIDKESEHVIELARKEVRANLNKDVAPRDWMARPGGVYVELNKGTEASADLAQMPETDIRTASGKKLTLAKPACPLRRTMDEFSELYGVQGRITSLQPLNPGNAPDEWEARVLERFGLGEKEVSEIFLIDGQPYLRHMEVFRTSQACLKCHAHQGYQLGDARSGVGVSVPLAPYLAIKQQRVEILRNSYGAIWLLGLFSIGLGNYYSRRQISKQWRVERALTEKTQLLIQERQLFITGPTIVFRWQAADDCPVEYVTPNVEEQLGYSKQDLETGAIRFCDLVHADDRKQIRRGSSTPADATAKSFEQEYRLRHRDGRYLRVYDLTHVIKDQAGRTIGYQGYIQDITERKRAIEQLTRSEEKYRSVINNTHEGFWFVDAQTKTLEVNDSLCSLLGYAREEMLGRTPLEFVDEKNRQIFLKQMARIPLLEHRVYEIELQRKDGSNVHTRFSSTTLWDKSHEVLGAFAFITDLTAQKQVEEDLRKIQERFNFALEGAQAGLWDWDIQTNEIYFSPRIETMLGYQPGEWDTHLDAWKKRVHPHDLNPVMEVLSAHLQGREAFFQAEYRMQHKLGHWVWIRDSGRVVERLPAGDPLRAVGIHVDIQQFKEAELALIEAKEQAEAATRAKSDFLATMSHEIRTPMNGVLGMAELLSETQLNNEQRDNVETILHSGQALLEIINDILDLTKLEAKQVVLESVAFDLEKLAHNVLELLAPQANDKGLELILDYSAALPRQMLGDPTRLRQVLINLVGNAVKFTELGHVKLKVECQSSRSDKVALKLSVTDTGIGIAAAKQADLFESFTQADQTTTRKYGGSGLGLSICRKLVLLMNGEIRVESAPGQGSTFIVSLELGLDESLSSIEPKLLDGVRVLLADENVEDSHVFGQLFDYLGMHADLLTDKQQVISRLRGALQAGNPYQIAILDQAKHSSDSMVLGHAIRHLPEFDGLRLIALTTLGHRGDAASFRKAGFDAYLNKPATATTLLKIMRTVLRERQKGDLSENKILTRHLVEQAHDCRLSGHQFQGKVLLVEDVPANQRVTVSMLTRLGVEVDVAENGLQAILQWKKGRYDLIFMDCRMPEMDGYEAARIIRGREQDHHVPIVALTANASSEDKQRCLRAGMNDIITKPFRKADLANSLKRWLGMDVTPMLMQENFDGGGDAPETEVLDLAVLQQLKEDMGEEFTEVMDAILQGIDDILGQLETEQASLPSAEIASLAHSLKSPSANLGAKSLYAMARDLEAVADEGALKDAKNRIEAMMQEFQKVLQALREAGF